MINNSTLEKIAQQLSQVMPPQLQQTTQAFEQKAKQILQQQLTKLDFVSREEFDQQQKMLEHLHLRLQALQQALAAEQTPITDTDESNA